MITKEMLVSLSGLDFIQFKLNLIYRIWLTEAFFMIILALIIAGIVRDFRSSKESLKFNILLFTLVYLICAGIAIGNTIGSRDIKIEYLKLVEERSPGSFNSDWGGTYSIQKRRDLSLFMAREAFLRNGAFRDYFDLKGNSVEFRPSNFDRQVRSKYLATLEEMDNSSTGYMWIAFGWLLVPIIGVALGFKSNLSSK